MRQQQPLGRRRPWFDVVTGWSSFVLQFINDATSKRRTQEIRGRELAMAGPARGRRSRKIHCRYFLRRAARSVAAPRAGVLRVGSFSAACLH